MARKTPAPAVTATFNQAFGKTHQALVRAMYSNRRAAGLAATMVQAAERHGFSDTDRGVRVTWDGTEYVTVSRV